MSSNLAQKLPIEEESFKTLEEYIISDAERLNKQYGVDTPDAIYALKKLVIVGKNTKYSEKISQLEIDQPPVYSLSFDDTFNIPKEVIKSSELHKLKDVVLNTLKSNNIDQVLDDKNRLQSIIEDHKFVTAYDPKETQKSTIKNIKEAQSKKQTNLVLTGIAPIRTNGEPNTEIIFRKVQSELQKFNLNLEFPNDMDEEEVSRIREGFLEVRNQIIDYWYNNGISDLTPVLKIIENTELLSKEDGKLILSLEKQTNPNVYQSHFSDTRLFSTGGFHSLFTFLIEHISKFQAAEAQNTSSYLESDLKDNFENYKTLYSYFEGEDNNFNTTSFYFYTILLKDHSLLQRIVSLGEETISKKIELQKSLVARVNEFLSKQYNDVLSNKYLHFIFEEAKDRATKRARAIREFVHTENFQRVAFLGKDYKFGQKQSLIIEALFEHFKNSSGNEGLTKDTLLSLAESKSKKANMRELFRSNGRPHPIWGTILKYDKELQTYKLDLLNYV